MFGRIASTEPRQQWLRGDGAWAFTCAGSLPGGLLGVKVNGSKVNGLGSGRRCT
jgi:hypothetical protein